MNENETKVAIDQDPEVSSSNEAAFENITEDTQQNVSPIPVLPQLSVALGILVFVFSVTYIGASSTLTKKANSEDLRIETALTSNAKDEPLYENIFDDTKLIAESAFVWDVRAQKILFNKNGDKELPLASITKLMTALVAYELLDPEEKVRISNDSLRTEGDSGLLEGEEFSMQDLADLTLISSSNDGAAALGAQAARTISTRDPEQVFVTAMNLKAKEIGLTRTYFQNTTGLDLSASEAGAVGSARDVAFLMEYIITNQANAVALTTLDVTTISNNGGSYHLAKNTNEVVDDIDGLIASKTGYTALAGGNLVVAFNAGLNRPIIVAVLGSSQNGRFTDTLALIEKARLVATHAAK